MENFDDVIVHPSVQFHSLLASPTKSIGVFLPFYRYSCRRRFSVKEAVNEILVALNRSTRMQLQLHTQLALCRSYLQEKEQRIRRSKIGPHCLHRTCPTCIFVWLHVMDIYVYVGFHVKTRIRPILRFSQEGEFRNL